MKFLLWKIEFEPYRLAKLQWVLFRLFGVKPKKDPCGHTKSEKGCYCHQPLHIKYCDVINEEKNHRVVCKCCGHSRMESSSYIDPYNEEEWIKF